MKPIPLLIVPFLAVVWVLSASSAGQGPGKAAGTEEERRAEATTSAESIELRIKVKATQEAGAPVLLEITLARSEGVVQTYRGLPTELFVIAMADANGEPVPLTRFGQQFFAGQRKEPSEGVAWGFSMVDLITYTLNLSRLFDLTLAGEYTVRVEKRLVPFSGDPFTLEATVEFSITEPDSVWKKRLTTIRRRFDKD